MYTFESLTFEFIKQNKTLLIGYIIVLIIVPIQDIGIPHVIGKLLESLKAKDANYKYIYVLVCFIILVQIGHLVNDFIEVKIYPMFQKFICTKILKYVFDKTSTNLQDILNGKIISIMAHAPRTMYNYMDVYRSSIIPQIVVFLIAIIYIGCVNVKLALILCFIIVLYYWLAFCTINYCKEPARERESYLIKVNEEVDDILMNAVGILNSGQKDKEFGVLENYYDIYQKLGKETIMCTMKYKFMLMPVLLASLVLFVTLGYNLVKNNKIKVEKFIVTIIIYLYTFNSIISTIDYVRDSAIRGGMVKEHLKIFNSMDASVTNNTPFLSIAQLKDKYLYFDNILFKYGEKTIMKDFTLDIARGEKLLIVGQIGSGKTTILKMLMRYNTPVSGHIYYMGTPIELIPREQIRKKIGYIPQNPILLNRTLYENVTYGTPDANRNDVVKLIKDLNLDNIFTESKLNMQVGKHGSKLSGGQRQVVWILRVLVQNPEILVMDEPTSAIDKDTKGFIDRLFEMVMKNRTVIIVSHDEYMSKLCSRTIVMPTIDEIPKK